MGGPQTSRHPHICAGLYQIKSNLYPAPRIVQQIENVRFDRQKLTIRCMLVSFILIKQLNVHCTNRTATSDLLPPTSSHPHISTTRYCTGNLKRQKFQFSSCDSNGTIFITVHLWEQNELYPLYRKELYPPFPRKSGAKERNSSRVPRGLQLNAYNPYFNSSFLLNLLLFFKFNFY